MNVSGTMSKGVSTSTDKIIVDKSRSHRNTAASKAVRTTREKLQAGPSNFAGFDKDMLGLYIDSMLQGAIAQTKINWGSTSAVMEASMAWFYASGVVFAALAMVIIASDFWKLVSGKLSEKDLVAVVESEEETPTEKNAQAKA